MLQSDSSPEKREKKYIWNNHLTLKIIIYQIKYDIAHKSAVISQAKHINYE